MIDIDGLMKKLNYLGIELFLNPNDKNNLSFKCRKNVMNEEIKSYIKCYESDIIRIINDNTSNNPVISEGQEDKKLTKAYVATRLLELGLTKDDVTGKNDVDFKLDEEELNDIRNDKHLFDAWVLHVYQHKQMKFYGIGPYSKKR